MNKTKILFLTSKELPLDVLNNSPRFLGYSIFAVAALYYLESAVGKKSNQLLNELCGRINTVQPKYLIVHLGLAFTRYPFEFIDVVLELIKIFPDLNVVMDRSFEYIDQHLNVIDPTGASFVFRERLIQNQFLFSLNEEAELLLSCLR